MIYNNMLSLVGQIFLFIFVGLEIIVSITVIFLVLLQRTEEGAFARTSVHNYVKNTNQSLRQNTIIFGLIFVILAIVLNIMIKLSK